MGGFHIHLDLSCSYDGLILSVPTKPCWSSHFPTEFSHSCYIHATKQHWFVTAPSRHDTSLAEELLAIPVTFVPWTKQQVRRKVIWVPGHGWTAAKTTQCCTTFAMGAFHFGIWWKGNMVIKSLNRLSACPEVPWLCPLLAPSLAHYHLNPLGWPLSRHGRLISTGWRSGHTGRAGWLPLPLSEPSPALSTLIDYWFSMLRCTGLHSYHSLTVLAVH